MPGSETIQIGGIDPAAYAGTAPPGQGDLTDEMVATDWWTDEMVAAAGIPVVDIPIVSVGGGMGSFVFVDILRVAGMPTSSIRVLSVLDRPWKTYEYLTHISQIPRKERLRSDSQSMPDNMWGFPSYALHEARKEGTLAPLWNVLTEPILNPYWTPRAGTVFERLEREANRVAYWDTRAIGQVRMARRRVGGGYFTILTPVAGTSATKRVAYRSRWVHLALGYPGVKFLDDLRAYRQTYEDYHRVVNAYEPHEHVYEELKRRPCLVMVRGAGIVGSRILQRLIDDRDAFGTNVTILHLFRTYVTRPEGTSIFARRPAANGWSYQGFNWPKSTWGGQGRERVLHSEGEQRRSIFLKEWGGTTTAPRKSWKQQLDRGRREGWYREYVGTVQEVVPGTDGTVVTKVAAADGSVLEVPASFVIDATGLEADIGEHRVLADLLEHGGAGRNPIGKLDCEPSFEVRGTRSEPGRMYAVGSPTLGSYYAPVDTFLGLQYAALWVCDELAAQGFVRKIGMGRSISQWWRWMNNRPPGA